MLYIVYKCSVFVYMNKLACIFRRSSFSLGVLVINFCIVETSLRVWFNYSQQQCDRSMCATICSHSLVCESDEMTSDGLDGQDASRPLSVDGEAVPGGEQADNGTRKVTTPL